MACGGHRRHNHDFFGREWERRLPSASVVIPVYNGESTIAAAIESALAQEFDGFEVVVVNDGSIDSTQQILDGYGSRITVVGQPNRGLSAARNAGVAASRGAYLAFLDADDLWLPGYLAKVCAALDRNPNAVLAFSDVHFVTPNGETGQLCAGRAPSMQDLLTRWWPILPSATVMRRSSFDACGGFSEEFRGLGHEDVYMWLRAREHGVFEYVAEPLVAYRRPDPVTQAEKYAPGARTLRRLMRHRYGRRAAEFLDATSRHCAALLARKALQQIDSGDVREAMRTGFAVLRYRRGFFFDVRFARRLRLGHNLRRLSKIFRLARSKRSSTARAGEISA
jgi:glycosyltransferase involved in cell wall biosynthesis